MFVNFRIKNYKSFKDVTDFSMEATKLKNLTDHNVFTRNNISLLKSAVIYGANASGKSNLLDAMEKMISIIKFSTDIEKTKKYQHEPFLLNTNSEKSPTLFEFIFIIDDIRYRYGFEINAKAIILSEWLYQKKLKLYAKEVQLFTRSKENIILGSSFSEGKNIQKITRDNALFLSVTAQLNGKISQKILEWFNHINILSNIRSNEFKHYSFKMLDDSKFKDKITHFIKNADTGITRIQKSKVTYDKLKTGLESIDNLPDVILERLKESEMSTIETIHMQYDQDNIFTQFKTVNLDFESDGTQKLLALSAPIIDTLQSGAILVIDELDNSMHTDLVEAIIQLFNSNETNPNNAQLIFSTHDTNLLNQAVFRRDQIWFTQKDIYGSSDLYSLIEYGKGKIRDDLALEKNYLKGKFGGKPHISSLRYEND